jgi:hypothetical protein
LAHVRRRFCEVSGFRIPAYNDINIYFQEAAQDEKHAAYQGIH